MTVDKTETEMAHDYLRYQWYAYECANKDKVNKIIREELQSNPKMRFDRVMMKIKRRCQTECR